jgi:O-acetyl-ADP-ribose deacetylase
MKKKLRDKKGMRKVINRIDIELTVGNIVEQYDFTAVVNAANAELLPGGGVAGAIHRAAGPKLAEECRPMAPISPGEAVITSGCNLPNKFVIHTLGPIYGVDKNEKGLLKKCYINSLLLAEKNEIDSIAFPAVSTGAFGYPIEEASTIALGTIIEMTYKMKSIKFIKMVLYSNDDLIIHKNAFENLAEKFSN